MIRKSELINTVGYVLVLCVLVAVASNVRRAYTSMRSTTQPVRVAGVQELLIGHLKIRAGKYFLAPFRIDDRMEGAHVVGRVRTPGSNNLIQVVIIERNQIQSWAEGQSIQVVFTTERASDAAFDVPIRQTGDYYVAFSNPLSASDKDVFGDVELRFLTH